jgi:hypothetical protein
MVYRIAVLIMVLQMAIQPSSHILQENTGSPRSCTNKSLDGRYGFILQGSNLSIGPYVLVGSFTADGAGQFYGDGTQSVNGNISKSSFKGSYSVDGQCRGVASLGFDKSKVTAPLDFVIVAKGEELLFIASGTNTVEYGSAKKE